MKCLSFALAFAAGLVHFACGASASVDWSAAERVSDGIALVRLSYESPRLMKAQAMRVDLSDKSLFFAANGRDGRWGQPMPFYTNLTINTRRVTAEEFMRSSRAPAAMGGRGLDMLVAFNSALWTPCPEPTPTPYAQLHGLNVSEGVVVSPDHSARVKGMFVVWKDGTADILPTPLPQSRVGDAWIAHCGWDIVLKDGRTLFGRDNGDVHPRTVVGLSADRRWFYVLVVEGRHEGVSIGADYVDLAEIMLSLGASDALNLDGGGSTELVRWDEASAAPATCLSQDFPPRRDALCIGICRRREGGAPPPVGAAALYDAAIDCDRGRSVGIYHGYEFGPVRETPPPAGYRPVYLSHYGRHGSRYQTVPARLKACAAMEAADKAGALTQPGTALLRRMRPLVAAHKGMFEALSLKGAQEHVRLARRMYGRFPGVFSRGGRVRCQSSVHHRCLSSMANFACALKGKVPQLDFAFETGERCMDVVMHRSPDRESRRARVAELSLRVLRETLDPGRLVKLLFADSPAAREAVGDPLQFVADLFDTAAAYESLDVELGGIDIFDFFTRDELLALARYENCRFFAGMGNSEELGDEVLREATRLAEDIVRRADDAAANGVCADLRFGHDAGLLPLAGLMGVKGVGDRVPAAESWRTCPFWRFMPMAGNMQIVLYASDKGETLAKVLFNERETAVRGLTPLSGPYYRWSDLRARLLAAGGSGS